jgi:hypothetical protein
MDKNYVASVSQISFYPTGLLKYFDDFLFINTVPLRSVGISIFYTPSRGMSNINNEYV